MFISLWMGFLGLSVGRLASTASPGTWISVGAGGMSGGGRMRIRHYRQAVSQVQPPPPGLLHHLGCCTVLDITAGPI